MTLLALPRSGSEVRRLGSQAVDWWLRQLAGFLPERVRRLIAPRQPGEIIIQFGRGSVSLTAPGRGRKSSTIMPIEADTEGPILWLKQNHFGSPARIVLSDDVLLRSVIDLPLAAESNMSQILHHQLARLVPLDPSSLRFVWRVTERLPARNVLTVEVTIVKKDTLSQAIRCAREVGLSARYVLMPMGDRSLEVVWRAPPSEGHKNRRLHRAAEICALALIAMSYFVYVRRLDSRLDTLRAEVAFTSAQMQSLFQLSQHVFDTESKLTMIRGRLSRPTPLAVLEELTNRMPMDAYITQLNLKPDQFEVDGVASHATALLSALAQSPMFGDPQFMAPITVSPTGIGEHFELGVHLRYTRP